MKFDEWLQSFPMRRAIRGKDKPGNSTCVNLFMRIHTDGKGFLMAHRSGDQPYPVANEERAVEVFRALWRHAQAEAPSKQIGDNG